MQSVCTYDVNRVMNRSPAVSWTRLLPNMTNDMTSVILPKEFLGKHLQMQMELTSDVNTQIVADAEFTTTEAESRLDTLIFDAYLMAESPNSIDDLTPCTHGEISVTLTDIESDSVTYTDIPTLEPPQYSVVPQLISFEIDLSPIASFGIPSAVTDYVCINLVWKTPSTHIAETSIVSNVTCTGETSLSFHIRSDNDPELYKISSPYPGETCETCISEGHTYCEAASDMDKYHEWFGVTDASPYPYVKESRCVPNPSLCIGLPVDCAGNPLKVSNAFNDV
eukprot:Blabericola_migrator_1__7634@NODE_38_length_17790_cov_195_231733_g34_i0_p6_GENE_NODE_38_length_17790_cov_195_231733_g34_i0NODE_38_length_17790_cov_195_231733_g34_i0_p6_ORF_typecomplete_len280_score41_69_NODE_38_length_17790_cov_195_231733_g34_i01097411813